MSVISAIAFSGFVHAGKTTAARSLEDLGFCYCRPSIVLAKVLAEREQNVTREFLQAVGNEIHASGEQVWLISETVKSCEAARLIAVDGIRWSEDRAYLAERFGEGFLHVHIAATESTLIARHIALGGSTDGYRAVAAHDVESGIPELASSADVTLTNDGALEDFRESIRRIALRFIE